LADGFEIPERGVDGVYSGLPPESGKLLGSIPAVNELGEREENVSRKFRATGWRERPGKEIMVSRPQSPNQ